MAFNSVIDVYFSEDQTAGTDVGNASVASYSATGGEWTYTEEALIDSTPLLHFRDGIEWSIIAEETEFGSGKEVKINTTTGVVTYNPNIAALELYETSRTLYLPNGGAADITEPLSLQDAKDWLKVETDADDDLITDIISAARLYCEKFANKSLVLRTVTATLRNELGGIYLPYGPIGEIVSASDEDDNAISLTTRGNVFKQIKEPVSDYIKVVYTAGYGNCPALFKTAIKRQIAYMYSNRGNETKVVELGGTAIEILLQVRDVV